MESIGNSHSSEQSDKLLDNDKPAPKNEDEDLEEEFFGKKKTAVHGEIID